MSGNYDDIINLPHHVSQTHPHMHMIDRAAQFSPFAALTGHDAAINETARLTDRKIELDDSRKDSISEKLRVISGCGETVEVEITYFIPDRIKDGGAYVALVGRVKKIDVVSSEITMTDGKVIQIENIYDVCFV